MKKVVFLLALLAAASCVFARGGVVTVDDAEWSIEYFDEYSDGVYMAGDGAGGVYVYSDTSEAYVGLYFMSEEGWLVNANPGDTLLVDFTVTGIFDDPENFSGEGIDYARQNESMRIRFAGDGFYRSAHWTVTSETVNGSTVSYFTSAYECFDARDAVGDFNLRVYFYPVNESDGSLTYNNMPAFRVSAPTVRFIRAGETVVPEPMAAAYALLGLGSLIGIKRRIKK